MEIIKGFFSFLFNLVGIVSSILGIWSVIRSPEEVKETLASWGKSVRSFVKIRQPKQPEKSQSTKTLSEAGFSELLENASDPSRGAVQKSDVKQRSQNPITIYLYIFAVLTVVTIMIASIISRPASIPEAETASPPIEWTLSGGMNVVSLFWMFVCLFGVIGAMRGWAKELLVVFSGVIALAVNVLLFGHFPWLRDLPDNSLSVFWARSTVTITLVYFGYQTVASVVSLASKAVREKLSDVLFGAVMGGINGYLIAGSILAYFHIADYPYENVIAPAADANFSEIVAGMMAAMPPNLLGEPGIYFAALILLIFILVVYG
jgi:hypothetical protein